jgi:hypothetical protein
MQSDNAPFQQKIARIVKANSQYSQKDFVWQLFESLVESRGRRERIVVRQSVAQPIRLLRQRMSELRLQKLNMVVVDIAHWRSSVAF